MTLEKELEIAITAITEAGDIILESRGHDLNVQLKQDGSPVTIGDKNSARYLTYVLTRSFPYGMLNEENIGNDTRRVHEYSWIIDPLDGTISYINGDDGFGLIIGLVRGNTPVLGVTYRPLKDELCYSVKGEGAYIKNSCEDMRLRVNRSEEIDMLMTGYRKNEEMEDILRKIKPARARQMYTAFKTIEVAKGNANLFVCPRTVQMNLWDVCDTSAILEEAGGRMTDLYGRPIDFQGSADLRRGVVASNGLVHDYVVKCIGGR